MKANATDFGICGTEQMFYAGSIGFDTEGAADGVELIKLPNNMIVTRAVAVVTEAFDAGTTNVLTVGKNDDANDILGTSDITEGTAGAYSKQTFVECAAGNKIKAKFTQTGTAATAGKADIYIFFVSVPD